MNETDVAAEWEKVARRDNAQAAIHPSGGDDKAYRESGAVAAATVRDLAVKHVTADKPWTYLDYGCGDGRVLTHLKRVYAHGFDSSETMAAKAMLRGCTATCDPAELDDRYTVVYALAVLIHHDYETGADMLARLVDLTEPGGIIIFDVPVYDRPRTRIDWTDVTVWTPRLFDLALRGHPVEVVVADRHKGRFDYRRAVHAPHVLRRVS